jgi:hypothetical protein
MTVDDSTPDTADEWQLAESPPEPTTQRGGGMLQVILDEVTAVREGAQSDRAALVDALAASFAKIELELEVLRDQLAAMTSTLTEVLKTVTSGDEINLPAVIERVIAAQSEANVEAVVAALGPPLAQVREAIPAVETANIAIELGRLRQLLVGPETGPEPE